MDNHPAGNMKDCYLGVETRGHLTTFGADVDFSAFSIGERLTLSVTDGDANKNQAIIKAKSHNYIEKLFVALVEELQPP